MTPEFRLGFNTYKLNRMRQWLANAREARLQGNNERFWYCMRIVELSRSHYLHPR